MSEKKTFEQIGENLWFSEGVKSERKRIIKLLKENQCTSSICERTDCRIIGQLISSIKKGKNK